MKESRKLPWYEIGPIGPSFRLVVWEDFKDPESPIIEVMECDSQEELVRVVHDLYPDAKTYDSWLEQREIYETADRELGDRSP